MARITPIQTQTKAGAALEIRAAVESDASDSLTLYRTVIEEGPFTLLQPEELTRTAADEASAIRADAEHPARLRLVASTGEQVIGMVRVACGDLARTSHFADIDSMRVDPGYRGQGIAAALLDALISWAESQPQIEKLGLFVFSKSEAAIRLYRSRGFTEEGRGVHDIKFSEDEYADTLIMGKHLETRGI